MRPRDHKRDLYARLARARGYKSRAAFKLLEIQEKYRIIKPGDKIVDLGCYPGGWSQVSSRLVGRDGLVVGVDVKPMDHLRLSNAVFIRASVEDPSLLESLKSLSPFGYDVVLSDLSPNVSGVWELDHFRQIELARKALKIAVNVLKTNGNSVLKVFHGDHMREFVNESRGYFHRVVVFKPRASRSSSSEAYLVCLGFTGGV